jgi:hypothetical protein
MYNQQFQPLDRDSARDPNDTDNFVIPDFSIENFSELDEYDLPEIDSLDE